MDILLLTHPQNNASNNQTSLNTNRSIKSNTNLSSQYLSCDQYHSENKNLNDSPLQTIIDHNNTEYENGNLNA